MKKAINLALEDEEIIELMRILLDEDAEVRWPSSRDISKAKRVICSKAVER